MTRALVVGDLEWRHVTFGPDTDKLDFSGPSIGTRGNSVKSVEEDEEDMMQLKGNEQIVTNPAYYLMY